MRPLPSDAGATGFWWMHARARGAIVWVGIPVQLSPGRAARPGPRCCATVGRPVVRGERRRAVRPGLVCGLTESPRQGAGRNASTAVQPRRHSRMPMACCRSGARRAARRVKARWWGTTGAVVASPLRNSCPPRSSRWSSSRTRTTIGRHPVPHLVAAGGHSRPPRSDRPRGRPAPAGAGHVLVGPGHPSRASGAATIPRTPG